MAKQNQQGQRDPGASQVTPPPDNVGVSARQVAPQPDRSKEELAADLTVKGDEKLGVLSEPEHEADKSSYPQREAPPLERPPFATARPDVAIVASAVTGAGAHMPPPPDQFDAQGRVRLDQGDE